MPSTIITKHSSTASAMPSAGQLVKGELAVNVTDRRLYTKDNSGAVVELGAGTAILYRDNFTGDGVTTAFTLPRAPLNEELVDIYINGLYQNKDTWTLSGATITFSEAPVAPDSGTGNIEVMTFQSAPIGETDANLVSYTPAGTGAVATNVQSKLREFVSVKDFGAVGDGVADDTVAIQAAIDYVNNVAGSTPRSPRTVVTLHIPAGQYKVTAPLLLYQKDGIRIVGDGPMNTQFIVGSNMAGFTYPAAWQALAEYATLQANPAVFQIARRRVTGVGSVGAGGTNLANTGYSQAGAVAGAWFYMIEGVGFFGRDTFPKTVHGIYSADIAQAKFCDIYAEGMDHAIYFSNAYSAKLDQIKAFDCVSPLKVLAGTSLDVSNYGATWCNEGYTLRGIYSMYSNMGCDFWGVGSYAYDISGMGIQVTGCGCENGLGGVLKCVDTSSRGGIHFDSCVFNGGVSGTANNYTGQTVIADFGVPAMWDFEGHYITFTNCALLSEILPGNNVGARLTNKTKIVCNLPADPTIRADFQRIIFNQLVTTSGSFAAGWPSVYFNSDVDKEWGSAYLATTQSIGSNVTYAVPFDTIRDGNVNQRFNTSTGEWVCKTGGVYRFRFDAVLTGDAYNGYISIQVTNRPAGFSTITPTHVPALAATNTERQVAQEQIYRLVPGDTVRVIVRRFTSGNAGSILANAQFVWGQVA